MQQKDPYYLFPKMPYAPFPERHLCYKQNSALVSLARAREISDPSDQATLRSTFQPSLPDNPQILLKVLREKALSFLSGSARHRSVYEFNAIRRFYCAR